MKNDNRIDDIVSMLDNFVSQNGGHMNINVNSNDINSKKIDTANSLDCSSSNMACNVPTFFEKDEN